MSTYIKRRLRFPDEIVHKRNTGGLGLGINAQCGARGNESDKVRMASALRYVNCPECIAIVAQRQAVARAKAGL